MSAKIGRNVTTHIHIERIRGAVVDVRKETVVSGGSLYVNGEYLCEINDWAPLAIEDTEWDGFHRKLL